MAAAPGPEAGRIALLAILVMVVMGLLARIAAIPFRLSRAELSGFLLVAMFSNGGNYGLPVVLFAFGNEALAPATVYFVTSSILTYTAGVFLAASGRRSVSRAIFGISRTPAIYGVGAAALLELAQIFRQAARSAFAAGVVPGQEVRQQPQARC